jgi:hypothetical protein
MMMQEGTLSTTSSVRRAMKNAIRAMVCVTVLASGTGCGDDDGGSSTSSGVSESKKLISLSDAEATKLCKWVQSKSDDATGTEKQYCTQDAASYADTTSECNDLVKECLSNGDYADEDEGEEEDCDDFDVEAEVGSDCQATVGELQDCLNAIISNEKASLNSASCSSLDAEEDEDVPASCSALVKKCPGFFEDEDADEI